MVQSLMSVDDSPVVPVNQARPRERVKVRGRVRLVRVSPANAPAQLLVRVADSTGDIDCVFLGRRVIAGIEPGATLCVAGRVSGPADQPRLFNPLYELCTP